MGLASSVTLAWGDEWDDDEWEEEEWDEDEDEDEDDGASSNRDLSQVKVLCYDAVVPWFLETTSELSDYDYSGFGEDRNELGYVCFIEHKAYTGKPVKPSPLVTIEREVWDEDDEDSYYHQEMLMKDQDYELSYKNNTKVGTASLTITGKGDYTGSVTKTFKIKYPIEKARVSKIKSTVYTGKAIKPKITYAGKTLKKGRDYTLSYKNNIEPGTATLSIIGKGKYMGSLKRTFEIERFYQMSNAKVAISKSVRYTGDYAKPKIIVKLAGKKLKAGKNYSVTYLNAKGKKVKAPRAVGTYTVIIKGKHDIKGKITREFKVKRAQLRA